MGIWFVLIYLAIMVTAYILLAPKPITPQPPSPDRELDLPTTEEGRSSGVVFGTIWVKDPVVAWWGDLKSVAIKQESEGGGK